MLHISCLALFTFSSSHVFGYYFVMTISNLEDLCSSPELNQQQQNNGKASVLCEAAKWLKEITGQIDSLKKENTSLFSESQYVRQHLFPLDYNY